MAQMKTCYCCGAEHPATEEFFTVRKRPDGTRALKNQCRACKRDEDRVHFQRRQAKAAGIPQEKTIQAPRNQQEPIRRTPTDHDTVRITFGKGWITPREPRRAPAMAGYQSSTEGIY